MANVKPNEFLKQLCTALGIDYTRFPVRRIVLVADVAEVVHVYVKGIPKLDQTEAIIKAIGQAAPDVKVEMVNDVAVAPDMEVLAVKQK